MKKIISNIGFLGHVPELLINSEKVSTPHGFDEHIWGFSRFRFSMIHTHDRFLIKVVNKSGLWFNEIVIQSRIYILDQCITIKLKYMNIHNISVSDEINQIREVSYKISVSQWIILFRI
jgi:hypothetical protein